MAKTLVYKFGGASVKSSGAVRNLAEILRDPLRNNMVIVVSAMGKTTNGLESMLSQKLNGQDFSEDSLILKTYHLQICRELFAEDHRVFAQVENLFIQLDNRMQQRINRKNYDEFYDGVIGFGELISSRIVAEYLCAQGLIVLWQDAREVIHTDSDFRFAKIDWERTQKSCQTRWKPILEKFPILTQGFIGSDPKGRATTLGREGSDFTAAILGKSLRAGSVTIWKDVPGVLNADPKHFPNSRKFDELSYREAAEMTYFGASVIHPKTIKPLANSGIPLFVKSFLDPDSSGTKIHEDAAAHDVPTVILKKDQILVSFKVTDFTFIEESHIHRVYEQLQALKLHVNMLQLSAISISIVIDAQLFKLEQLLEQLRSDFEIRYNSGLELLTILHPTNDVAADFREGYEFLLEQAYRNAFQAVRRKI
jgi:aspartate kinase